MLSSFLRLSLMLMLWCAFDVAIDGHCAIEFAVGDLCLMFDV